MQTWLIYIEVIHKITESDKHDMQRPGLLGEENKPDQIIFFF